MKTWLLLDTSVNIFQGKYESSNRSAEADNSVDTIHFIGYMEIEVCLSRGLSLCSRREWNEAPCKNCAAIRRKNDNEYVCTCFSRRGD